MTDDDVGLQSADGQKSGDGGDDVDEVENVEALARRILGQSWRSNDEDFSCRKIGQSCLVTLKG